mmetsp:Transcript_33709/g.75739  ORF Transcript_33709/g.75739 Transcript_33709/m.75739 type:complete len:203 (-) Transcript_33709:2103-2711(-)
MKPRFSPASVALTLLATSTAVPSSSKVSKLSTCSRSGSSATSTLDRAKLMYSPSAGTPAVLSSKLVVPVAAVSSSAEKPTTLLRTVAFPTRNAEDRLTRRREEGGSALESVIATWSETASRDRNEEIRACGVRMGATWRSYPRTLASCWIRSIVEVKTVRLNEPEGPVQGRFLTPVRVKSRVVVEGDRSRRQVRTSRGPSPP